MSCSVLLAFHRLFDRSIGKTVFKRVQVNFRCCQFSMKKRLMVLGTTVSLGIFACPFLACSFTCKATEHGSFNVTAGLNANF